MLPARKHFRESLHRLRLRGFANVLVSLKSAARPGFVTGLLYIVTSVKLDGLIASVKRADSRLGLIEKYPVQLYYELHLPTLCFLSPVAARFPAATYAVVLYDTFGGFLDARSCQM